MKVTRVKRLDSGYWHVRFGHNSYAQWPAFRECFPADVFCSFMEDRDLYANKANDAVRNYKDSLRDAEEVKP